MRSLFAYVTQKNRDIEVTVANIVPPLLSLVTWTIPDMSGAHHNGLNIEMQVQKKRVTYSDGGIITVLTCRPPFGATGGGSVTTGPDYMGTLDALGSGGDILRLGGIIWNGIVKAANTNVSLPTWPTDAGYTPETGFPGP